tara:strand:+ start:975 stop:1625 length:651 start_codon:yes stop_codon:yes gene_type:complete
MIPTENSIISIQEIIRTKSSLIMDFDGTIADTSKVHSKAFKEIFREYGIEFDYKRIAGMSTKDAISQCLNISNTQMNKIILNKLVSKKQYIARDLIKRTDLVKSIPGSIQFIKWAKKFFHLSIASSGSKETVKLSLDKLGILNYFQIVVCSEDVQRSKPEPDIFLETMKKGSFKRKECIIFEDSDAGIKAAKASKIDYIDIRNQSFESINQMLEIS